MQCVTTPSAFASLVPVNLQTLKGRLFAFGGLIFCSLLLVFFIVVFAVSVGHADEDCHSHLVRWWSVSLSLYAFNLFLYAGFCFYVFKMQGGANPHYISERLSEKQDLMGLLFVLLYLVVVVITIGWDCAFIAYIIERKIACVGTGSYVGGFYWAAISILTLCLPLRIWRLFFCLPWGRICSTEY